MNAFIHSLADRPRSGFKTTLSWSRVAPALAVIAVGLLQRATLMPNADIAWYATILDQLDGGKRLYVDIIETNPPFAVYLYWPAHVLGKWLSVRTEWAIDALVFALGAASLVLCRAILQQTRFRDLASSRWMMVAILAIVFVLPAATFGEREHIALIAVLPFLCLQAARAQGYEPQRSAALLTGLLGGLAILAKPHFALGIVPAIGIALLYRRSLRVLFTPEIAVAISMVLAYLAIVVAYEPAFFSDALPLILRAYVPVKYDAATFLWHFRSIELCIALLLGFALRAGRAKPTCLHWMIVGSAIGFDIAVVVQGKGMPYHFYPPMALALLLAAEAGLSQPFRRLRDAPLALGLAVVLFGYTWTWLNAGFDMRDLVEPVRQVKAHPRIVTIGYDFSDGPPISRAVDGVWLGSVSSQWASDNVHWLLSSSSVGADDRRALEGIERQDRDLLAADLRRHPDVILIQRGPDDWLPWSRQSRDIAAILDTYRPAGRYQSHGMWTGAQLDIELWRKAPATPISTGAAR